MGKAADRARRPLRDIDPPLLPAMRSGKNRKDIWRPHSAELPGSIEVALPPPAWSRQTRCCCFQSSTKQICAAQASAAAIVVWATTIPRW